VFRDESKTNVVDFRKKQGSAVHFRAIYNELRAQLADIVLQPKEKEKEKEKPKSTVSSTSAPMEA